MDPKRQQGFTLLELLVVVAIIAILAALAIVNYIAALNRAKQKKTVSDIRTIAMAWEARASEVGRYSVAGFTFPDTAVTQDQLRAVLVPTYTQTFPTVDGWGRPLQFGVEGNPVTEYGIRSAGRDGSFESSYTSGATTDPDCDIVYSGGSFIVYPDTIQSGN